MPVAENTELICQNQSREVQWECVPEVAVEHTRPSDVPTGTIPQVDHCFPVVAFPGVDSVLLGPHVDHVLGSEEEGVGEHAGQVAGETSAEVLDWHGGVVSGSPDDGQFVDQPVVAEEGSEGSQDVFDVQRRSVAE